MEAEAVAAEAAAAAGSVACEYGIRCRRIPKGCRLFFGLVSCVVHGDARPTVFEASDGRRLEDGVPREQARETHASGGSAQQARHTSAPTAFAG